MFNSKKTYVTLAMLCFVFFLTACERLKKIDENLGKVLDGEVVKEKTDNSIDTGSSTSTAAFDIDEISKEQKGKIDMWLKQNGFNRYGDPEETFYTGGTPLFNEKTGETIERFEYILKKVPDILNKI